MEQTLTHQSSTVKQTVWNSDKKTLRVEYVSGNVYEYSNVDQSAYDNFNSSPSKGKAINDYIRDTYPYVKIS